MSSNEKRERKLAYLRSYREEHKAELAAKAKTWRQANRELHARRQKASRDRCKDRRTAQQRAYYLANIEKRKLIARTCRLRAKDRYRAMVRQRYANDPLFRLKSCLRRRLNHAIKNRAKSGSAIRDLGCTIAEFIEYIATLFQPGMTWGNWGRWHLDHIKPLAAFDLTDRAQLLIAFNYTNYQPLWASDNMRKGAKVA